VPDAASDTEILRAHDAGYLQRVIRGSLAPAEVRRIGFPWSEAMVERSRRSAGATLAACRAALADGCAANLAGGTHHAFRDRGEGFCVFNDAAIAALAMRAEGRVARIAIIDCDVHQGNGTAAILARQPECFTFSLHGARNFPFEKETSDLDVELPDDTGDTGYLDALDAALPTVFARAAPQLVIYLAGADPFAGDRLGRLKLSKAGLAARDELVLPNAAAAACRWPSPWPAATPATSTTRWTSTPPRSPPPHACSASRRPRYNRPRPRQGHYPCVSKAPTTTSPPPT
jgi:acetoin utilization deacetylase AcuC-like enzyme